MEQQTTQQAQLTDEQVDVIAKLTKKFMILGASARPLSSVVVGPIVSVYKFMPAAATRVSQMEAIADDMAIELGVEDVVIKRMPGDSAVGVFVPNKVRTDVKFVDTTSYLWSVKDSLTIPLNLGVTQSGQPLIEDLASLPHLLIAGATGSGKSTLLTTIITSIMVSKRASEVKFVLSDTKGVEFRDFEGMRHLMYPVTYDADKSVHHLELLISEMEERLTRFGSTGCHNINEFNKKYITSISGTGGYARVVLVIDELADIMEVEGEKKSDKSGQKAINKLAQKARASGIHILAATQRPSVNIVSGSIKANFPARLTFRLPSDADSRTVIGTSGAEHLLSQGDMFYVSPSRPGLTRAHAPWTRQIDIASALKMAMGKG